MNCPSCGGPTNRVEGNDKLWCNACLAWHQDDSAASVSKAVPAEPAKEAAPGIQGFKAGRVAEAADAGGTLVGLALVFWLLDTVFIVAGLVLILTGWTKLGAALILFGVAGGLFLIF